MKTITTLAALMVLTACASVAPGPATSGAAPDKPAGNQVATANSRQVCEKDESLGSRMKRPRCYDVPEGNEKAYREDLLREKTDELRQYNESTTLQGANPAFGR